MTLPDITKFLGALNDEGAEGHRAAEMLLAMSSQERDAALVAHPEWMRVGTFEAVLRHACDEMDRHAARALELTTFVLDYVDELSAPDSANLLLDLLRGTAHKHHATALFRVGVDLIVALENAGRAVLLFSGRPAFVVDRASARFVQSQIWHALGQTDAAFEILDECETVFAEHGAVHPYVKTLIQRGYCLFDLAESGARGRAAYREAYHHFRTALKQAQLIKLNREIARIYNNLGHCVAALNKRVGARAYFTRALAEFVALRMTGEVQRSLWGIAELDLAEGQIDQGVARAWAVYDQLLARGMPIDAGLVLLDVATKLDEQHPERSVALQACQHLNATLAPQSVPRGVRRAVRYLAGCAVSTTGVALRGEMARVYDFFTRCKVDPTADWKTAA